jgi:ABC-2 type transport system ATP-binding protein
MDGMPKPMISVENLRIQYGAAEVLKGVSFKVFCGDFFGLLGSNGAGKTTLVGALAGVIDPAAGEILIDGLALSAHPMKLKSRIGFVPQSIALYPSLCAQDNLAFFARIYGMSGKKCKERIAAVLEVVGLTNRARQTVAHLSHGMRRRLNIAAGLLHEPEILILDEPTVGLDTHSRAAILTTLEDINQSGITLLFTTHRIKEAEQLCSRVGILDGGQMIALDTPAHLVRDFGMGIVRLEFKTDPGKLIMQRLKELGGFRAMNDQNTEFLLETKAPAHDVRRYLDLMATSSTAIKRLDVVEPGLETVFNRLTSQLLKF